MLIDRCTEEHGKILLEWRNGLEDLVAGQFKKALAQEKWHSMRGRG